MMCMMQWLRKVRQWNDVKLLGHIVNRNLDSLRDGVIEFYNRWWQVGFFGVFRLVETGFS